MPAPDTPPVHGKDQLEGTGVVVAWVCLHSRLHSRRQGHGQKSWDSPTSEDKAGRACLRLEKDATELRTLPFTMSFAPNKQQQQSTAAGS